MSWRHGFGEWEFPKLKDALQFSSLPSAKHQKDGSAIKDVEFWSVKFYPYTKPGVDPIYAVVGSKHILICRPPTEGKGIEVIRIIIDEESSADHYACCWTKDLATQKPLLCVAGVDAKIKVFDVLTGKLLRVLVGHGGEIDELIISPTNPHILASCSEDTTIRIWSLDPKDEKYPCAAILSGGHRATVRTIAFHQSGRYLVSGGEDHVISLWTLPNFPDENTGTKVATQIQYPHFTTSEIHTNAVDCIYFYNDSILSRAATEQCIVLWDITGFDSQGPIPGYDKAPIQHEAANGRYTLTCFTDPSKSDCYVRLIEFSAPETGTLWIRFSFFQGLPIPESSSNSDQDHDPNQNPISNSRSHPILAITSYTSKIYFWDLHRLTAYNKYIRSLPHHLTSKSNPKPESDPEPRHPSYSSIFGLPSGQQTPIPDEEIQTPLKRPPFLTPHRPRNHRALRAGAGAGVGPGTGTAAATATGTNLKSITNRLREISPSSSTTTATSTSGPSTSISIFTHIATNPSSHPSTQNPQNPQTLLPALTPLPLDKIPTTPTDIKIWDEKYSLRQKYPLKGLKAHRVEVVKGVGFLGRGVAWSRGGEWCVVAGGQGVVACLGR
ncbi:0cca7be2-c284-4a9a-9222-2c9d7e5899ba [Sclerotinia trifoliorum]|uniref:0cca7be2-c284-4a9a-9222-2c9d7e5899ba n=1 Tax=Sclerotinia trifoliorum TaxID=28548 RepID=A0A8H2VL76_9HELO|nr:0cca7be2-c284-4a9a-9222-2c9d7e5899ba [Sclerotinia trifoliorum]